ncbi:MAG: sigma-70 family RNA polymerase sigma factor [Acidimicrobiales bacterium]
MDRLDASIQPTVSEMKELLAVAKLGAYAAGARGVDIDDTVQTSAEKLVRQWSRHSVASARAAGQRTWHAFIITTTRRSFYDLVRSNERRRARERRSTIGTEGNPAFKRPGGQRRTPALPTGIDRYLARLEVVELIDECEMTREERVVITLHLVHGLASRQISAQLGTSAQMVNRYKRNAIKKLRDRLDP